MIIARVSVLLSNIHTCMIFYNSIIILYDKCGTAGMSIYIVMYYKYVKLRPRTYVQSFPLRVQITWSDPVDLYVLCILDPCTVCACVHCLDHKL